MKVCVAVASAAFLGATLGAASAGPIVDAAQQAETLISQGKPVEGLDALDAAVAAAWDASPLAFRKATLSADGADGGDPKEIADGKVQGDEKVAVYMEPVGFAVRQDGDQDKAEFAVDWTFENATGQVILDQKDYAQFTVTGHGRPRSVGLTLRTSVPYVRPGTYVSTYTVRDKNSSKSASYKIPLTVVPAAEAPAAGTAPAAGSGQGG